MAMCNLRLCGALPLFLVLVVSALAEQDRPTSASADVEQVASSWLVIEPVGRSGRAPFHTDAIEAQVVAGQWAPPKVGDRVRVSKDVERVWRAASPGEDGWIRDAALRGGYACMTVEVSDDRVVLLDAAGHRMAYANGEPRGGDVYGTGWPLLPVRLKAGVNTFLFPVSRGGVFARLIPVKADAQFNTRDLTLPDILRDGTAVPVPSETWAAAAVINATADPLNDLMIETSHAGGGKTRTSAPVIPARGMRKVGFRITAPSVGQNRRTLDITLKLLRITDGLEEVLDSAVVTLRVREPSDKHKRTFISSIDGSVQYFAVTPKRSDSSDPVNKPALFLSLHGASVEATNQANAYDHKSWGHIVAPTNRRPYGFDWEDWGLFDALEVLEIASDRLKTDPDRTYLTGHSMGGHGVWYVGARRPDLFAAVGPSAGWPDFWTYAGAADYENPTAVEQMLLRAASPSRAFPVVRNYLHHGVYVLHGNKDDNVPVGQARMMREKLGEFHPDFAYYERPGAGHWWGGQCVDWPPMFEFFRRHTREPMHRKLEIEFHTSSPGVSASSNWLTVLAQRRMLEPSNVRISLDPVARRFTGTTTNVARMKIDLLELCRPREKTDKKGITSDATVLPSGEPLVISLDGETLSDIPWPAGDAELWVEHGSDGWAVSSRPSALEKSPLRYGPFKEVFYNRFVLVYPTRGTAEENAVGYAKARFDAETWWYRGNGAADVVADSEFDVSAEPDRNVVLYGNADTNAIWETLLSDSPVQVRRGGVSIDEHEYAGDDLACLFIRPRPGSDSALIGAVSGSGVAGLRLTERLPYFLAGVAYPDCIVFGPEVLTEGTRGIRAAGFFEIDWSVGADFAE